MASPLEDTTKVPGDTLNNKAVILLLVQVDTVLHRKVDMVLLMREHTAPRNERATITVVTIKGTSDIRADTRLNKRLLHLVVVEDTGMVHLPEEDMVHLRRQRVHPMVHHLQRMAVECNKAVMDKPEQSVDMDQPVQSVDMDKPVHLVVMGVQDVGADMLAVERQVTAVWAELADSVVVADQCATTCPLVAKPTRCASPPVLLEF
jgi:hypothetical protein